MNERVNLDKKLLAREEELKRIDGKLQNALRDRTAAESKVSSLEKELVQKEKANDVLKNKVLDQLIVYILKHNIYQNYILSWSMNPINGKWFIYLKKQK